MQGLSQNNTFPHQLALFEDTSPLPFKRMTDPNFMKPSLEDMKKQASVISKGKTSEKYGRQLALSFERSLLQKNVSSAERLTQQKKKKRDVFSFLSSGIQRADEAKKIKRFHF